MVQVEVIVGEETIDNNLNPLPVTSLIIPMNGVIPYMATLQMLQERKVVRVSQNDVPQSISSSRAK